MLITQYILNLDVASVFRYEGSGTIFLYGSANVVFKPVEQLLLLDFRLGEYFYDYDHNVWQVVAIQGSVLEPVYVAQRLSYTQFFIKEQMIKFGQETPVFNSLYDKKIAEYEAILQRLDEITV